MNRAARALKWVGTHERETLIALMLVALGFWGFIEIADYALEGDSHAVDERILLAMRTAGDSGDPVGPVWLEELARDVTALGGTGFVAFLTLAAAGFLAMQRHSSRAAYLLVSIATGTAASFLLKAVFDRERPDLVAHGQTVYTSSFPSGHSMMSALAFFTVAALLARSVTSRRLRAYLLGLAAFLALAVGASRVYLGVHWPTDVLAGWTAGSAWALLCWTLDARLRHRGRGD